MCQLLLPSGKCQIIVEGSHVTTELGVLSMGIHDTFLTPRILRWLLDVLEDFWTPGAFNPLNTELNAICQ